MEGSFSWDCITLHLMHRLHCGSYQPFAHAIAHHLAIACAGPPLCFGGLKKKEKKNI